MPEGTVDVWKLERVVQRYLRGVRSGIPLADAQLETMARLIAALEIPVTRFLDLGCGDGILGALVLECAPPARGVLLDFSEPMITAAREKLASYGEQVTLVLSDYGTPAWLQTVQAQAPFDVIVSGFSIHHQPDERKRDLYKEIYHLLSPGGLFLNLDHVLPESPWAEAVGDAWFIDNLTRISQANNWSKSRAEVADLYTSREDKTANILAPAETQCAWLREIGYRDVACHLKVLEFALFGGRR